MLENQGSFGREIHICFLALLYFNICFYKFTLYIRILGQNLFVTFPFITKECFVLLIEECPNL